MYQPEHIEGADVLETGSQPYRELLLTEKAQLQSELRSRLESLSSGHMAAEDQAPILHEQFVSIRRNNLAHEKMKAIEAALERLKRGTYGVCQECGEHITEKRLKAVPWTPDCLTCQETLTENGSLALQPFMAA